MSTTTIATAPTSSSAPPTFEQQAQQLVDLDAQARTLAGRNAARSRAGTLTGADVDEVIAVRDRLGVACEEFRVRHYPRAGRVVAVRGLVLAASPAMRRVKTVYDAVLAGQGAGS